MRYNTYPTPHPPLSSATKAPSKLDIVVAIAHTIYTFIPFGRGIRTGSIESFTSAGLQITLSCEAFPEVLPWETKYRETRKESNTLG